ncbi:MAG: hypothetical protein WCJ25_00340 [Candidatus Moraniibacteriota bacterium]
MAEHFLEGSDELYRIPADDGIDPDSDFKTQKETDASRLALRAEEFEKKEQERIDQTQMDLEEKRREADEILLSDVAQYRGAGNPKPYRQRLEEEASAARNRFRIK